MPRILSVLLAAAILSAAPLYVSSARAQTASTTNDATQSSSAEASSTQSAFDQYNPDDVAAKVRAYFADVPVMVDVARCESGFRQYDDVGNPLYGGTGGMVGVFQEAAAIHEDVAKNMGLNINTLDGNLAYARYLYKTEGLAPWLASSKCWSPLKSTLGPGSKGSEVTILQQMLNAGGFIITQDGPGAPGQESTTFGPLTEEAVRRFQCQKGIVCGGTEKSTGYGSVGTKTRLALLKFFGTSGNLSIR